MSLEGHKLGTPNLKLWNVYTIPYIYYAVQHTWYIIMFNFGLIPLGEKAWILIPTSMG